MSRSAKKHPASTSATSGLQCWHAEGARKSIVSCDLQGCWWVSLSCLVAPANSWRLTHGWSGCMQAGLKQCGARFSEGLSQHLTCEVTSWAEEPFRRAVRNRVEWGWSWRQPYLEASPSLFHCCHLWLRLGLTCKVSSGIIWARCQIWASVARFYPCCQYKCRQRPGRATEETGGPSWPASSFYLCYRAVSQEAVCNHFGIMWHQMSWCRS